MARMALLLRSHKDEAGSRRRDPDGFMFLLCFQFRRIVRALTVCCIFYFCHPKLRAALHCP